MAAWLRDLDPACAAGIAVIVIGGICCLCLFLHINPRRDEE